MAVVGLRTSSIRKMWRDLESEGRAGEKVGVLTAPESPCSSSLEVESMESEDTSRYANGIENECPQNQRVFRNGQVDIPEKERERKIFHVWGSKSFGGNTLYSSRMNNCSRAKWLGENECKRVRIVREWIESSTQEGDGSQTGSEEPATEIDSQIKRIRDGAVNSCSGARSSMRRIYGRQALLDLLKKFVRERETELERLLENQFVSNFGHRQRIQSLLKGRFLRNQTFVEDEKQTSVAASELGLLRQTHAVSDRRKGFLSTLNKYRHAVEDDQSDSDTSSENKMNFDRTEQAEEIVQEIPDEIGEKTETTNVTNKPELASPLGERQDNSLQSDERKKLPLTVDYDTLSDNEMKYVGIEQAEEIVQESPDEIGEEFEITNLICNWESHNQQEGTSPVGKRCDNVLQFEEKEKLPLDVDFIETRSQDQDDSEERNRNGHNVELSQETMGTNVEELEIHGPSVRLHPFQTSTDSFTWQESEDDDDDGIGSDEGADVISNENEHEWYQETLRSDFQEYHEEWNDNVMEDVTESWFGGNSYLEATLVDRSNVFYSSDDDNGSKVELRELSSRRRVSNLLQSDFGARLDRLLQSYLDRQDQAFESEKGWQQDHEHQSLDENEGGIEAFDRTESSLSSPSVIPLIQRDNDLLQDADDRQTEREIINGLRIDMNTLQQRMNDMQKVVEACMDMQLQLQQSMKQEVYSALNRLSNSEGLSCFLCCDDGFESLPDRSVHMYICSKCAEKINLSKLKESIKHP